MELYTKKREKIVRTLRSKVESLEIANYDELFKIDE